MRVAMLCGGLDSVQRGYETHQRLLFDHLSGDPDFIGEVVLFKRDGANMPGREVALRSPSRASRLVRALSGWRGDALYWEAAFFAVAFVLYCIVMRRRFDTLLIIEPNVCRGLHRMRRILPGSPRIVYTHGVADPPQYYIDIADEVHEVNIENYKRSLACNRDGVRIHLVPHFVPATSRVDLSSRQELRQSLNLRTSLVLLVVGVVQRASKRVDYVISEASKLPDDWTLLLCGVAVEPDLLELGRTLMGERFVHVTSPRDQMSRIYDAADVFALGSLHEGFGIVIVEAMSHGLPVVVHDRELFRWITRDDEVCIDLAQVGALAGFMAERGSSASWRRAKGERNALTVESLYSWKSVRRQYLELAGVRPQ